MKNYGDLKTKYDALNSVAKFIISLLVISATIAGIVAAALK